jgi:3'-phosphoadenosine 5'-phosphosulfate (PAPS) 3'-phosphatase
MTTPDESPSLSASSSPSTSPSLSRSASHSQVAQRLGITAAPLRLDSQCKYGALARGDASVYMRFPPVGYREKIWDHAAGVVIVSEAGGAVTDAAGNALDFSRGRWLDLQVRAASACVRQRRTEEAQGLASWSMAWCGQEERCDE